VRGQSDAFDPTEITSLTASEAGWGHLFLTGRALDQQPFEAAARSNGVEPIAAPVPTAADIEHAFASLGDRPAECAPDNKRNGDAIRCAKRAIC
jgi:hypothetical protein